MLTHEPLRAYVYEMRPAATLVAPPAQPIIPAFPNALTARLSHGVQPCGLFKGCQHCKKVSEGTGILTFNAILSTESLEK